LEINRSGFKLSWKKEEKKKLKTQTIPIISSKKFKTASRGKHQKQYMEQKI
jgi:hypothetical protein